MSNLRMALHSSSLERTMRFLNYIENTNLTEKVYETLLVLGDCMPSGSKRENLGITYRQMLYVIYLAGFDRESSLQFCDAVNEVGGMDSQQAHYLINRLKQKDREAV